MLGGRGAGKTRPAPNGCARWCAACRRFRRSRHGGASRWSARRSADVREVMIEGASGILPASPRRPAALASRRAAGWSGRTARSRRSSRPRTRTACAGRNSTPPGATSWPSGAMPKPTWDMLQFGLRLGDAAAAAGDHHAAADRRCLKRLIADPATAVTRMRTADNARQPRAGLPRGGARRAMPARGSAARSSTAKSSRTARTRCGRAPLIEAARPPRPPELAAHRRGGRPAGERHARLRRLRHRRRRARRRRPRLRARRRNRRRRPSRATGRARPCALYHRLEADCLVAEVNQGGDMVAAVIAHGRPQRAGHGGARHARQVAARRAGRGALRAGPRPPCRRASRRSRTRCATSAPTGCPAAARPTALDALVWAITELLAARAAPSRG